MQVFAWLRRGLWLVAGWRGSVMAVPVLGRPARRRDGICNTCYSLDCNLYRSPALRLSVLVGNGLAARVALVIGRPHLNATGQHKLLLHILSNFYTNCRANVLQSL